MPAVRENRRKRQYIDHSWIAQFDACFHHRTSFWPAHILCTCLVEMFVKSKLPQISEHNSRVMILMKEKCPSLYSATQLNSYFRPDEPGLRM